jgi:hypothetical protein
LKHELAADRPLHSAAETRALELPALYLGGNGMDCDCAGAAYPVQLKRNYR